MGTSPGRRWQRRVSLTIGCTLAAGLTLGYLGLRAVGDREHATEVAYTATSVLIRDRMLAELSTLEAEIGRRAIGAPLRETSPGAAEAWLGDTSLGPDWDVEPLLIRDGGGVTTASLSFAWTPVRLGTSVGSPAFADAIREAETKEFGPRTLETGLAAYRRALTLASGPDARALAWSRIGRVLFKLLQFDAGLAAYREVLNASGDIAGPNGIPYAVTARLQSIDGLDALGRRDDSLQVARELLVWMIEHPWDGRDGYTYYLSRARRLLAGRDPDLDARVARRIDALDHLEWIDHVARPRFEAALHTSGPSDEASARFVVDRGGQPVLVTARRLKEPSAAPAPGRPMWLGVAVDLGDLAGPLLARVLGGIELGGNLIVAIVNREGRVLGAVNTVSPLASADLGAFTGWRIALLDSRGRTLQQLGARERWIYGSLVSGTVVVLLAGLLIAARAWTREAELSRLRADFVSNVSHELKTPLALIRMFGETLESGLVTDPARQHEFHGIIRRESERLTHLINNVLDIQKIDAGTKRFTRAPSDLGALLLETLDAYEPLLGQLGFTVSTNIPASPVVVDMDRNAIAQALVNLFQNAIKYSHDTRAVAVSLVAGADDVRVAVRDSGVGIAAAEIPRIFEKYYRVATIEADGTAGSGLGLAIVQHAMTGHDGRVEVSSVVGEGSTFTLVFPRTAHAAADLVSDRVSRGRVPHEAVH
jgi:signal transduction histidine kinase